MEKVIEYYKPDVLMFHDDWGTQNNMFFSPDVWRSPDQTTDQESC